MTAARLADLPETGRSAFLRESGEGRIACGHRENEHLVWQVAAREGLPYALDPIAPCCRGYEVYVIDAADPSKPVEWMDV